MNVARAIVRFVTPVLSAMLLASASVSLHAQEQVLEQLNETSSLSLLNEENVCGNRQMTIARMRWPSANILSHIHNMILRGAFECQSRLVAGDTGSTGSAMATAQLPAIAPELWVSRIPDIWNAATDASSVLVAGPTYGPGDMQGWFVPKYVTDNNPDLKSLSDLERHWQVFRSDANDSFGTMVSCPSDWACAIINRNMIRGLGLENRLKIETPEDGLDLDRKITRALSSHKPILFYYWQPAATLDQSQFTMLRPGTYSAKGYHCNAVPDCADPSASGYGSEPVVIALAAWVYRTAPIITDYFNLASMPLETMNELMAWQSEFDTQTQETALYFLKNHEPVWSSWMSPARQEKMRVALDNGFFDATQEN